MCVFVAACVCIPLQSKQLFTTVLPSILITMHFQAAVDRVMDKLQSLPKKDYLVPLFINAETGQLRPGTLSMGARADTYYEYLLKQWVQSGGTETRFVYIFLTCVAGWLV